MRGLSLSAKRKIFPIQVYVRAKGCFSTIVSAKCCFGFCDPWVAVSQEPSPRSRQITRTTWGSSSSPQREGLLASKFWRESWIWLLSRKRHLRRRRFREEAQLLLLQAPVPQACGLRYLCTCGLSCLPRTGLRLLARSVNGFQEQSNADVIRPEHFCIFLLSVSVHEGSKREAFIPTFLLWAPRKCADSVAHEVLRSSSPARSRWLPPTIRGFHRPPQPLATFPRMEM